MSNTIQRLSRLSNSEETLNIQLRAMGVRNYEREFVFFPRRKWRFDFAFPAYKIAIEIEGGAGTGGRHTRKAGFEADCIKYNTAQLQGWRVFRFTSSMVKSGNAIDTILLLMKTHSNTSNKTDHIPTLKNMV